MSRFNSLSEGDIREKSGRVGDVVTAADYAAEEALHAALTEILPGSTVVGEEAAASDPTVLNRLLSDDWVWVVDPLDGTANFASGGGMFGIIVALIKEGETYCGWVLNPVEQDFMFAAKGKGTWYQKKPRGVWSRRVIQTTNKPILSLNRRKQKQYTGNCETIRPGSVGREYMEMCLGKMHVGLYEKLRPWDHLAGLLMHREAGGYAALLPDERPYPITGVPDGERLLVAPTKAMWDSFRQELEPLTE